MKLDLDPQFAIRQARLQGSQNSDSKPKGDGLKAKCREFEAIFLQQMFKEMRSSIPRGGLLDEGMEQNLYEEMMDAEAAKALAFGRGIGIAEGLYRQLEELEGGGEA